MRPGGSLAWVAGAGGLGSVGHGAMQASGGGSGAVVGDADGSLEAHEVVSRQVAIVRASGLQCMGLALYARGTSRSGDMRIV